jgi:hypothetical protein
MHLALFGLVFLQARANPYGPILSHQQAAVDPHWTGERPRYGRVWDSTIHDVVKTTIGSTPQPLVAFAEKAAPGLAGVALLLALFLGITALVCWSLLSRPGPRRERFRRNALDLWERAPELLLMPFAALALYVVARILLFHMYLPMRYLMFAFPFFVSFCSLAVAWCYRDLFDARGRNASLGASALATLVGLLFVFGLQREPADFGLTVPITDHEDETLAFIRSLPKDSLIFAPSKLGNVIPLLGRRSILWNFETHQIFHLSYAEMMDRRARAGVKFLTEGDSSALQRFDVTHVVLERKRMAPGEPFDPDFLVSPVYDEYAASPLTYDFELAGVVYQNEDWTVIELP